MITLINNKNSQIAEERISIKKDRESINKDILESQNHRILEESPSNSTEE